MAKLKQENTENRSSVFGRIIFCISSLRLILAFHLNLLLKQVWKSQASPQAANQTFVSTSIHIHPCIMFIIQNLFDHDNNDRGKLYFLLLPKLPELTGNSWGLRNLQCLWRDLENTQRSPSLLLWPLHIVQVLWIASNAVADPMKSPHKIILLIKSLSIKIHHYQVTDNNNHRKGLEERKSTVQCSFRQRSPFWLSHTHMRKPFVYTLLLFMINGACCKPKAGRSCEAGIRCFSDGCSGATEMFLQLIAS